MTQGAICVALKCPENYGDSLCRHSKVMEGLDMHWHEKWRYNGLRFVHHTATMDKELIRDGKKI